MSTSNKSSMTTHLFNECIRTTPGIDKGKISDGHHTFDELYEHRNLLFVALCRRCTGHVWRSRVNADGSVWDGLFVAGLGNKNGEMITYHLPDSMWDLCDFMETLDKGLWDGHSSGDVIDRLYTLIRR